MSGRVEVIWSLTSLSKHFIMTEVRTGTRVALLKHVGTADWDKD